MIRRLFAWLLHWLRGSPRLRPMGKGSLFERSMHAHMANAGNKGAMR